MGVPTSEVGYTSAIPRMEDHEVPKGHVVAFGEGEVLIQKLYIIITLNWYVFLWISEQTENSALHSIKRLVFITEVESVQSAVRTGSLYKTDTFCV